MCLYIYIYICVFSSRIYVSYFAKLYSLRTLQTISNMTVTTGVRKLESLVRSMKPNIGPKTYTIITVIFVVMHLMLIFLIKIILFFEVTCFHYEIQVHRKGINHHSRDNNKHSQPIITVALR